MGDSQFSESCQGLGCRIHARFARLGSVARKLPDRASQPIPALLDDEGKASSQGGSDEAEEAVR